MTAKKSLGAFKTKRIEITEGVTGRKLPATLAACPECDGDLWLMYFPEDVDHCHFQCSTCGASFCDGGCAK